MFVNIIVLNSVFGVKNRAFLPNVNKFNTKSDTICRKRIILIAIHVIHTLNHQKVCERSDYGRDSCELGLNCSFNVCLI